MRKNVKNIVYICAACESHLDWGGIIETLQRLKMEGHNVFVASGTILKKNVEKIGLNFLDIGLNTIKRLKKGQSILNLLKEHRKKVFFNAENTVSALYKTIKFFKNKDLDIVVCDAFSRVGPLIAIIKKIPYVIIAPEAKKANPKIISRDFELLDNFNKRIKKLVKNVDLPYDSNYPLNQVSPYLNIYYTTESFYGKKQDRDNIFVGGDMIRKTVSFKKFRPCVYYSSGTLFWDKNQINNILGLVEKFDIELHVSKGSGLFNETKYANKVYYHDFFDEKRLLPNMDLVITQGGVGTVNKVIRAGIPMIVLPLFHGNYRQALNVQQYGNGICLLDRKEQIEKLSMAVNKILYNEVFKSKARKLQKEYEITGGSKKATRLILKLCN